MRFVENGPDIPGSLLDARDQGSVVFFCGSGVSRHRACLPDFIGLAQLVVEELKVPHHADAQGLLQEIICLSKKINVSGLLSTDLLFGLLERDYSPSEIRKAVARAIKQKINNYTDAHAQLLNLARTPAGRIQLVTTNFDRLFSDCDVGLRSFVPPNLPKLTDTEPLDGIVYLHGRLNQDYSDIENGLCVLSSADFGNAYLSSAWATDFVRELMNRFVVVFVGYSGDDPPIRYLLEGMHQAKLNPSRIFAFQSNDTEVSMAKWSSKGVTPIGFKRYEELWTTIGKWADASRDLEGWRNQIANMTKRSPRDLKPFERGQVAHLVSSFEGSKKFASVKPTSEWLFSFDPGIRCLPKSAGDLQIYSESSPNLFECYGLDSDPLTSHTEFQSATSEINFESEALNVLDLNLNDKRKLKDQTSKITRPLISRGILPLTPRLVVLAQWIAASMSQPACLWWVSRQTSLHPDMRGLLWSELRRTITELNPKIANCWQILLSTEKAQSCLDMRYNGFDDYIQTEGWSVRALQTLGKLLEPKWELVPREVYVFERLLSTDQSQLDLDDICGIEVKLPELLPRIEVPDNWLIEVCRQLQNSIWIYESALEETYIGEAARICPFHPDPDPEIDTHDRYNGFSGLTQRYAALFQRLIDHSGERAKHEFQNWPTNSVVFDKLRLWAISFEPLLSSAEIVLLLKNIDRENLWNSNARRDLLISLRSRWNGMPAADREEVEQLLLDGPPVLEYGSAERKSFQINFNAVKVLTWLELNGCELTSNAKELLTIAKAEIADWQDEWARNAAESREIRGGIINKDTECAYLLDIPESEVITLARSSAGRVNGTFLTDRDAFMGYCEQVPTKALGALRHQSSLGDTCPDEWRTFLYHQLRKKDSDEFSIQILNALLELPDDCLLVNSNAVTFWMVDHFGKLILDAPNLLDRLLVKYSELLPSKAYPETHSQRVTEVNVDWVGQAMNSSVGRVIQMLLDTVLTCNVGNLDEQLGRINQLLKSSPPSRYYAFTILCKNASRIYNADPKWAVENIFPALNSLDESENHAAWAGMLWQPFSSIDLFEHFKSKLLKLAVSQNAFASRNLPGIFALIVDGWMHRKLQNQEPIITDDELHDVILNGSVESRCQLLLQLFPLLNEKSRTKASDLPRIQRLLGNVWPKEMRARGPRVSARIFELLFVDPEVFELLVETGLTLLEPFDEECTYLLLFLKERIKKIVAIHPDRFLDVLATVLPDSIDLWPSGVEDVFQELLAAHPNLVNDVRFEKLRQRWHQRY
jgi:hypothetical protein